MSLLHYSTCHAAVEESRPLDAAPPPSQVGYCQAPTMPSMCIQATASGTAKHHTHEQLLQSMPVPTHPCTLFASCGKQGQASGPVMSANSCLLRAMWNWLVTHGNVPPGLQGMASMVIRRSRRCPQCQKLDVSCESDQCQVSPHEWWLQFTALLLCGGPVRIMSDQGRFINTPVISLGSPPGSASATSCCCPGLLMHELSIGDPCRLAQSTLAAAPTAACVHPSQAPPARMPTKEVLARAEQAGSILP